MAIVLDDAGEPYITGTYGGTTPIDFDPGPGAYILPANSGLPFVWKLDAGGNFQWVQSLAVGSLGSGADIE
ncbi:hypothetical protein, partial [Rhizobium leguminosarum]|uniref:hypothetical protein n=1 Tax=Rhizobium leguminosarum TaxID=384 RepID=UPI003F9E0B5E